jgi:hypothetical protein
MYRKCFAAINEIVIYGYPVIKRISTNYHYPSMITDLVQGGSVYSPSFLFDEQHLNIEVENKQQVIHGNHITTIQLHHIIRS